VERTPEPELMDGPQQALAYAQADFSAGDQALVERLVALFPEGLGGQLLDLGCGPGNIALRLVALNSKSFVVGLDGAPAMLALAEQALQQLRRRQPAAAQRLCFVQALLPTSQPASKLAPHLAPQLDRGFSAVVCNSLLHHLHDPQVLWNSMRQLAAPGAAVYVKDLRRPASPEAALVLRDRYLADAPLVLQRDYVASLHAAFRPAEVVQQLQRAELAEHLQVGQLDDRYLEVWGRLPGRLD